MELKASFYSFTPPWFYREGDTGTHRCTHRYIQVHTGAYRYTQVHIGAHKYTHRYTQVCACSRESQKRDCSECKQKTGILFMFSV